MLIQYDIQTDELFLEGIEQGLAKGIEQGIAKHSHDTVVRMLQAEVLTAQQIADFVGVTMEYVQDVQKKLQEEKNRQN